MQKRESPVWGKASRLQEVDQWFAPNSPWALPSGQFNDNDGWEGMKRMWKCSWRRWEQSRESLGNCYWGTAYASSLSWHLPNLWMLRSLRLILWPLLFSLCTFLVYLCWFNLLMIPLSGESCVTSSNLIIFSPVYKFLSRGALYICVERCSLYIVKFVKHFMEGGKKKLSQVIWYLKIPENSYTFKEEKNLEKFRLSSILP